MELVLVLITVILIILPLVFNISIPKFLMVLCIVIVIFIIIPATIMNDWRDGIGDYGRVWRTIFYFGIAEDRDIIKEELSDEIKRVDNWLERMQFINSIYLYRNFIPDEIDNLEKIDNINWDEEYERWEERIRRGYY